MSVPSEIISLLSPAATQEAQRLLREANTSANSSKRLLHRVRSKLQGSRGDSTYSIIVHYVDCRDTRPLDVLQALLQKYQSQVNIEKFQCDNRRLTVIVARHGHTEILKYLLAIDPNPNLSQDEALSNAILFGHIPCVKVLLQKCPSTSAIQRALLTTDLIELDQAREIARILLDFKLPHSVFDYLKLKLSINPPNDFDSEILSMLIATNSCSSLQANVDTTEDSADLATYFKIQRQVSTGPRKRNTFGDETMEFPNNLILIFLERYIRGCSIRKDIENPWPMSTVNLLLDRMPIGAESLSEYGRCIALASNFEQVALFTQLLRYRILSTTALQSLSLYSVVKNAEMIDVLLAYLNQNYPDNEFQRQIVKSLFVYACGIQLLPRAIQICSRSCVPVPISTVLQYLKVSIAYEKNIQDISNLLQVAKVEENDLDLLWNHISSTAGLPINTALILLRAGYSRPIVAESFLRWVRSNEEVSNLPMIIDQWSLSIKKDELKASKVLDLQNSFDYRARKPFKNGQPVTVARREYFSTLAAALRIGIERQQLDLCEMLLERGAPLVSSDISLLEQAVLYGVKYLSIDQDKVLLLVFNTETERSENPQSILDFTLLQAVKHFRYQIIAELVNYEASTLAYGYECWHLALRHAGSEVLLRSLMMTARGSLELSRNFRAIFASFARNPATLMPLTGQMRQAGFVDHNYYLWVFQILCEHNSITVQDSERLIEYGAFEQPVIDQCLELCRRYCNLSVFRILVKKGISPLAAKSMFESILQDFAESASLLGKSRSETAFGAMILLISTNIPEEYLDRALHMVALLSNEPDSLRIPVLMALLEKGAWFSEHDGLGLTYCFLMCSEELTKKVNASAPPEKALQEALQIILNFPAGTHQPITSCRLQALVVLLASLKITLTDWKILETTYVFLSLESNTPTDLIHYFYGWLRNQSSTEIGGKQYCIALEWKLDEVIDSLANSKDVTDPFIERITAVLTWVRPRESTVPSAQNFSFFHVPAERMSRYLIASSEAGHIPIVRVLIEAGVSPNVFDSFGRSALSRATTSGKLDMVKSLIDAGADPNEGSLHEATCLQHHAIMRLLLNSGHDRWHVPASYSTTPMEAFVYMNHSNSDVDKFSQTITTLMEDVPITPEVCSDLKSAVQAALSNPHAFDLILAFLPWLQRCFDVQPRAIQIPVSEGPLRYSLVSLVGLWKYTLLTQEQRQFLTLSLQGTGFDEMFYTTEGEQPDDAVNIPKVILKAEEARKRRAAFLAKECCIHGEKADSEEEVHAALTSTCDAHHGWKDDIVCTDCLRQHLETRMFPHDDLSIKHKFPSTKIPCWAPNCPTTELPHDVLQQYCDPEMFQVYDFALFQAVLREGKSMAKCASPDCDGAHWYDEEDEEDEVKIFLCEVCFQNTCMECNDLYEKHDNQPCPAGEQAKNSERIKGEETLSEAALKLEKRCPNCGLMYLKYTGCDHITCGKDSVVDKGCHHEFCDVCFGPWPRGHTTTCGYRNQ